MDIEVVYWAHLGVGYGPIMGAWRSCCVDHSWLGGEQEELGNETWMSTQVFFHLDEFYN